MKSLYIPRQYNYIAAFLTLRCNFKCNDCINDFDVCEHNQKEMSGKGWLLALNRIKTRPDLPITLQGGEPTIHKDFYEIINGIEGSNIDLITNLSFDVDKFMSNIKPEKLNRGAKYANIRTTYYPDQHNIDTYFTKITTLNNNGYSIGVWLIDHPEWKIKNDIFEEMCKSLNIDVRHKEFLGYFNNKLYGTYKYTSAINGYRTFNVKCRTTELLIAPDGDIYRCHADLYSKYNNIGNVLSNDFNVEYKFIDCNMMGKHCNPCDIKLKNNRLQEFGHCSVEMKETEKENRG
jgi:sulfatase maturation enzyme AslB (radical SAM superfamily)